MEGAMAASRGALGGCSCLEFARNKELMCSRRADVRGSSFPACSRLQDGGLACCAEKNALETRKLKPLGHGFLSDKKMITLLEALSKDLSVLSDSVAQSHGALPVDDRGRILADALEVVMTQLAEGRAERKQRKRQLKALKKALKARKDKSSTSPSDSADRACEVVDMSQLCGSGQQEKPTAVSDPQVDSRPIPAVLIERSPKCAVGEEGLHLEFGRTADRLGVSKVVAEQVSGDKIEVCMGPKCKKMGSDQLLAAFEGCGVEAVGCKCMGKCRSAPNVRVRELHSHDDDGWRSQLHLGVGIGEVDLIVSHHFGQQIQGGAVVPA